MLSCLAGALFLVIAPTAESTNKISDPASGLTQQSSVLVVQRPASHCRMGEQVLFNCKVDRGPKIISLCGSKQLTDKKGYLQYRFGKPGAIELQFPQNLGGSQAAFRYDHYFRYRVDRTDLHFENGGYEYVLFNHWEGDVKPEKTAAGVSVTRAKNDQDSVQQTCRGNAVSRLGLLESVVPILEPSELNPD